MDIPGPEKLRLRTAAWARFLLDRQGYKSIIHMAREIHHDPGSLTAIINATSDPGYDFAARLAWYTHWRLDTIAYEDPPGYEDIFSKPGRPPRGSALRAERRRSPADPLPTVKRKSESGQ